MCLYGFIDSTKLILETFSAGRIDTIIETPIPMAYEIRIVWGWIIKDTVVGISFCAIFWLIKGTRNCDVKIAEPIIEKTCL